MAGVRGGRTHPGLPRSPTTVLKTAGTTGHHPLPPTILRAITLTLLLSIDSLPRVPSEFHP